MFIRGWRGLRAQASIAPGCKPVFRHTGLSLENIAESLTSQSNLGHQMNRLALLVTLWLTAWPCFAQEAIPPHLVGVWASDDAVLKGELLFEGTAVYLDSKGIGAVVGGPPPIGFLIRSRFNAASNTITFDGLEDGKVILTSSMAYDPATNTILADKKPLHRRFEDISNSTRKALSLPTELP